MTPYYTTVLFLHFVGVVEIVAGLIVLSRWTKIGSYIVRYPECLHAIARVLRKMPRDF